MRAIKAHFDGKVLVPDEPVDLPLGKALIVKIEEAESQTTRSKRKAGLHRGTATTSPDFDKPLPDAFWLGKK